MANIIPHFHVSIPTNKEDTWVNILDNFFPRPETNNNKQSFYS
jgi:hypothetical protein